MWRDRKSERKGEKVGVVGREALNTSGRSGGGVRVTEMAFNGVASC